MQEIVEHFWSEFAEIVPWLEFFLSYSKDLIMAVWHIAMYKKSKLKRNGGEKILSSALTQYLNFSGQNRFTDFILVCILKNTILDSSRPTQIEQHCVQ